MTEKKCKNCVLCIQDDGSPYCAIKDLYTHVDLEQDCDEKDIKGERYFTERAKKHKKKC